MGVECFYVNVFLNEDYSISTIVELLKARNLMVSPYYHVGRKLCFKKYYQSNEEVVVNSIVKMQKNDFRSITLLSCFSCYKKGIQIIYEVLSLFNDIQAIEKITFNGKVYSALEINNGIFKTIYSSFLERLKYFQKEYTDEEIDVLPDSYFFDYYKKNRKRLHKSDSLN